jgi:tetrahydromethanopterin S-methyltransferase subunit A
MPENVSLIGPGILKGANMGSVIFTLAENNFNLAEAAQKALITGSAKNYYDNGVMASFSLLGASGAVPIFHLMLR